MTMSLRAFARHVGVVESGVRKALATGRLEQSVARDADGVPYIADVALALREWNDNRDPAKVREGRAAGVRGPTSTITQDRARLLRASARRMELQNARLEGALLDTAEVESAWAGIVVATRDKLRGVPAVARQAGVVDKAGESELARLIDQALEELASAGETPDATKGEENG